MVRDAQGRLVINTAASDTADTADTSTEQQQQGTTETTADRQLKPEAPANPQQASATAFEGLSRTLAQRRQAATTRRDEAAKRWQDRIAESGSATMALARSMKPASTADEEKRLRMLAIGQALGELVGAGISGGIAFGKRGQGYVQPGTGLAWQTLDRLNKLKAQGVAADREYSTRMNNILSGMSEAKANQARHEYDMSEAELRRLDALDDYVARQVAIGARQEKTNQQLRQGRLDLENKKQEGRRELERQRQGGRVYLKSVQSGSGKSGKESVPDDVAEIKEWLLPKEKTTIKETFRGEQRTTAPYTSYPKEVVAAAEARARKMAPVVRKHNLAKSDVIELDRLLSASPDNITWQNIDEVLDKGYTIEDILLQLRKPQKAQR